MNTQASPGIGHNQAPPEMDQVTARLLEQLQESVVAVLEDLGKLVNMQGPRVPLKFDSEDYAKKGIELAIMLNDLVTTIEVIVYNHRKDLADTAKLMNTNRDAWIERGAKLRDDVREKITAYMLTLPKGTQLRTEFGSLAILQWRADFEVEDEAVLSPALKTADRKRIAEWLEEHGNLTPDELREQLPGVRVFKRPQLVLTDGKP